MKVNNCLHCGQEFEAKRSDKKYCSDSCKQQAYKSRKNDDTIGDIENATQKINPAVFPFLKDYLRGLLSGSGGEDYPTNVQADVEQVRVTKSGKFIVESTVPLDIKALNERFLGGQGTVIQGRTKAINVEKIMDWDGVIPVMQSFHTDKIMIPYELVREQFAEYSDDDLIIE